MNSAKNVFKQAEHFHFFEKHGYVVLPLFDPLEIKELERLFNDYFPDTPNAFFSSSYLENFELKKEISDKIEAFIKPKLEQYFVSYRCIGAAFLSKAPDQHSELPMHQDWTIVDESQYLAANIWTPITTLTESNGTLEVLPGSHKTFRSLRAPTIPFSGNELRTEIKKHLKPLYVKPGEAVILDQALVHYSSQNKSDKLRLAFTTGLVSEAAPLHFHYWNKETNLLEKFKMDDDFLFRWEQFHTDIFQRPKFGETLETVTFEPQLFTIDQLNKTLGIEPVSESISKEQPSIFFRILKAVFK